MKIERLNEGSGELLNKPCMDVVLIHGWGLNRGVWQALLSECAVSYPSIRFHCLDIPGYGEQSNQVSSADLAELADACLQQAPPQAVWVGWSLGGMIALQAALQDRQNHEQQASLSRPRVLALQLINSTPKFVQSDNWQCGVPLAIFQQFCDELTANYQRALQSFLLLQAGSNSGARTLAKQAVQSISQYAYPTQDTLQLGIDCLANNDLRDQLACLPIPTQVVCGKLDRVTNPQASEYLARHLDADFITLKTGHAPFISQPEEYLKTLLKLLVSTYAVSS